MMCGACNVVNDVPVCAEQLQIGLINDLVAGTAIAIYVTNETTGRVHIEITETNADKYAILDMSQPSPDFYNDSHGYSIAVASYDDYMRCNQTITLPDCTGELTEVSCVSVHFKKVYDGDGELNCPPYYKLSLI